MTTQLARLGAALAIALVLAGCVDRDAGVQPSGPAAERTSVVEPGASGVGLEVRYLDADGNERVLRPEDFPRR